MEPLSSQSIGIVLEDIQNDVKEIKTQTKITNGRVNNLENWQAYMKGGLAVIVALLIPIVLLIVNNYIHSGK